MDGVFGPRASRSRYAAPIWDLDEGRPYFHRSLQGPEDETQYGVHFPPIEKKLNSFPADQVQILTETAGSHLIKNEEGRVIGVEAEGVDGPAYVKAKKGVVLSCAGVDHDLEMAKRFNHQQAWGVRMFEEGLTHPMTFDSYTNTGDGVRMGMEAGGDVAVSSA